MGKGGILQFPQVSSTHLRIFAIFKTILHLWLNYSLANRTLSFSCDIQLRSSHIGIRTDHCSHLKHMNVSCALLHSKLLFLFQHQYYPTLLWDIINHEIKPSQMSHTSFSFAPTLLAMPYFETDPKRSTFKIPPASQLPIQHTTPSSSNHFTLHTHPTISAPIITLLP